MKRNGERWMTEVCSLVIQVNAGADFQATKVWSLSSVTASSSPSGKCYVKARALYGK